MTNTISTPLQEATCSFEEVINLANTAMANMLRQVIAFQQTIFTRTENPGVPTQQELTFQARIINSIDKLRRFQGRNHKTAGITGFIRFVATKDKNLSKTMLTHYTEFAEKKQSTATQVPNDQSVATAPQVVDTTRFRDVETAVQQAKPVSAANEVIAPFTEQDYEDHKHLLGTIARNSTNSQFKFRGTLVNARWFEYNIFQYALPVAERRFINSINEVCLHIDQVQFQKQMRNHFSAQTNKAA